MPTPKTFPISKSAPPAGMIFPNLVSAAAVEQRPTGNADQDAPQSSAAAAVMDDGFTPE